MQIMAGRRELQEKLEGGKVARLDPSRGIINPCSRVRGVVALHCSPADARRVPGPPGCGTPAPGWQWLRRWELVSSWWELLSRKN